MTAAVLAVGCGGETADDVDGVQSAVTEENALSANALSANALSANALTATALRDPLAREFLKYVVSCALDDHQRVAMRIDGRYYQWNGSLGLAPEWGRDHGSCDGECQRWVSACVLARVDAAGVKRMISLRGDHPALRPEANELRKYIGREATYYGNVFVPGQPRFFCLSPGKMDNERVCGDSLADCPMTVVGSCDDACADEGAYGRFEDCSDRGRARRGTVYHEAITVFLPKQMM